MATSKHRFATGLRHCALLALLHAGVSIAHDGAAGSCDAASREPALASARQSLERTPRDLQVRLALADSLVTASCYEDAVHVLQDGEALHPRNSQLQKQLQAARSFLEERRFFEGLDRAELAAQLSRHTLRCRRFGDVAACDQALALQPSDVALVLAKGDAMLKADKPLEALDVYARATALDPTNADAMAKVKTAQALQATLEARCASTQGDAALTACEALFRVDAPNGFELARRIGVLQQAANRPTKALESYITANSLRRGDQSVALAILALLDSTGRNDAIALAARGSSLVAVGRARDGLGALRQARELAPELPGLANQIDGAERLLKQEERMRELQPSAAALSVAVAPARTHSNLQPASRSN